MIPILEAKNITKTYKMRSACFAPAKIITAVDDASISLCPGESLALVGESGCGKTTFAKIILALEKQDSGEILFEGRSTSAMTAGELKAMRRRIQPLFHDPFSSLNPRMSVSEIVAEPMIIHSFPATKEARQKNIKIA